MKKISVFCLLFSAFTLTTCDKYDCYQNFYLNVTDYKVKPDTETPILGIPVMANGYEVDLQRIDEIILYVEDCLGFQVKRNCLEIVIPPDWYVSECTEKQLFPCRVDIQLCRDKGIEIDPDCEVGQAPNEECPCPCNCRATIQDENVIITAPNLETFSAELIRMMTSVNNIWEAPELVKCYIPGYPEEELSGSVTN